MYITFHEFKIQKYVIKKWNSWEKKIALSVDRAHVYSFCCLLYICDFIGSFC